MPTAMAIECNKKNVFVDNNDDHVRGKTHQAR